MASEFISNNMLSLAILLGCIIGNIGLYIYNREREKGKFGIFTHLFQFILWSCIIVIFGGYAEVAIADWRITVITSNTIDLITTSLIALILIRKLFLMIGLLEKRQITRGMDITTARIISRILKITLIVVMVLLYGEHFGMSLSGLMTFGGIGGIAIGMAGKDILSNLFSGIMLYFDRPFSIGDWVRSPDRNIEGTVVEIGWRITKIITFDHRPLYIPNSIFASISVENPGRMTNRRINTTIGLRYEDSSKIGVIASEIRTMLKADPNIDQHQTMLVYFNNFGDSSLDIMIYCFTKTTVWAEWLNVQQEVYLKIIDIVHKHDADFAFPSRSLYVENPVQTRSIGGENSLAIPAQGNLPAQ